MKNFLPLLVLGALFGVPGCQPHNTPNAALKTEGSSAEQPNRASVMRQHDAQMARMDALATERQRLTAALARLDTATASGRAAARRLRRTAAALVAADSAMMAWMHDYREPAPTPPNSHQHDGFWADQSRRLAAVDRRTTAALDSARRIRQTR